MIISPRLSQGRLNAAACTLLGNPTHVRLEWSERGRDAVYLVAAQAEDVGAIRLDPGTGNLSTAWAKQEGWEAGAHDAYAAGEGRLWFKAVVDDAHFFEQTGGHG